MAILDICTDPYKSGKGRKLVSLMTLLAMILLPASSFSSMRGKWVSHPSFYQQTEKIIDGESKTYFMLHQQTFAPAFPDHGVNTATLFRFDKEDPDAGIIPLSGIFEGMPTSFRTATYSPSRKWLTAAAENGSLWIIPDDAQPFCISGLENINYPGKPVISSITENPADGRLWVAATYGYAVFNPDTRTMERFVRTDFPVDFLCPIGDSLIIIADSTIFGSPLSELPSRLDSLKPIPLSPGTPVHLLSGSGLASPANLMPLTSDTFAYLGPGETSKLCRTIAAVTRDGNLWRVLPISDNELRMLTEGLTITFRTANNAYPNKDGFYIHSQNTAAQLMAGIDPDLSLPDPASDFKSRAYRETRKIADSWRESASWDSSSFWFFINKKGFYRRKYDSEKWENLSDTIWPQAPTPFASTSMCWHPVHGLLVSDHGIDYNFQQSAPSTPWLVSAFRNGVWKNLSPVFSPSAEITSDESFNKLFSSTCETYPLTHPKGLAIDPSCPAYAYAGSLTTGWARINLDHPDHTPLHIGNPHTSTAGLPGFVNACPAFSAWTSLCNFSQPEFDTSGRLWMVFQDYDASAADAYSMALCFYTPEDLESMKNAHVNTSLYKDPHRLTVKVTESPNSYQQLLPLRAESNRNILAFTAGCYQTALYLLDHNGTPDDTSDDRLVALRQLYDSSTGNVIDKQSPITLWEDPYTADLWMGCSAGAFRVNPREAFDNPSTAIRHKVKSSPSANADIPILEGVQVNGFTTDAEKNLWIATNNRGAICLSADRETIIGDFSESNSPLPSNRVFAICYNPERRSLMMSTAQGLTEFFPESLGGASAGGITVSPQTLTPSFRGWVTFTGLPADQSLRITDNKGQTVRLLGKPAEGMIQWDGNDSYGQRPASGTYRLTESDTGTVFATIRILN